MNDIRAKYLQNIDRYCDPFVGGGVLLLDVLSNFQPNEVLLNDINAELVNTYMQVPNNVDTLIERLNSMQNEFWSANTEQ